MVTSVFGYLQSDWLPSSPPALPVASMVSCVELKHEDVMRRHVTGHCGGVTVFPHLSAPPAPPDASHH